MIRSGLALFLALTWSGAPAALQMCGSHCVAAVSCHDSSPAGAQSVVKTGPQVCPHTAALGALIGGKPALPTQAINQAVADVGSPAQNAPPTGLRASAHFLDPHHPFAVRSRDITQLRI